MLTLPESFTAYSLTHGLLANFSHDAFPTLLLAWNEDVLPLPPTGTHFGYVYAGQPTLQTELGAYNLNSGMYFSLPDSGSISGGRGVVMTRLGYRGMFSLGGPIEATGRLRYIDGCTDSLLIPPVLKGDACLNALYFPPGIDQTAHTHPSIRLGIIARGRGECVTPMGTIPLTPGQIFCIHAEGLHCFRTGDSPMTVIAYHPDSDFGATHAEHPMLNRTIVDGVSARYREEIRTRS